MLHGFTVASIAPEYGKPTRQAIFVFSKTCFQAVDQRAELCTHEHVIRKFQELRWRAGKIRSNIWNEALVTANPYASSTWITTAHGNSGSIVMRDVIRTGPGERNNITKTWSIICLIIYAKMWSERFSHPFVRFVLCTPSCPDSATQAWPGRVVIWLLPCSAGVTGTTNKETAHPPVIRA